MVEIIIEKGVDAKWQQFQKLRLRKPLVKRL